MIPTPNLQHTQHAKVWANASVRYGSQLHIMQITLLSSTEYQEQPLLQLLPQVPTPSIITDFAHQTHAASQPDSLWGGKRLHHMDIIGFSGGTSAPSTGGGPMPPTKMADDGEFAVVIDGNWTTMPAASRLAIRVSVIVLLLIMFDIAMAPSFWSAGARRVISAVAAAAAAGRRLDWRGEKSGGLFRTLYSTVDDRDADDADSEEMQSLTNGDGDRDAEGIGSSSSSSSSALYDTSATPTLARLGLSLTLLVRYGDGSVGVVL
jgi:hypothetical protein